VLTNKAVEANDGKPLPLLQKAAIGLTAGAIGACVGSPADLALIRMQADATLPAAQRRNYKNAFHALYHIIADEGVLALWKGAGPTVVRAMSLNMGMLASYDQSVELFRDSLGLGEVSTVIGASAVSGFFASACSLPFDYVKTQIQKMQPDAHGKYPYTGSLDCATKTLKSGGPFKFYIGFPIYCVRIALRVMVHLRLFLSIFFLRSPFLDPVGIRGATRGRRGPQRKHLEMTWPRGGKGPTSLGRERVSDTDLLGRRTLSSVLQQGNPRLVQNAQPPFVSVLTISHPFN
ncbi:mitochondrial dicarboxylate/tricarboxylate transporter DTC-like, partial [Curcuma longa]|uniref:mitochondrial dicarboxylate/tricarboxylate transporter DTC-like n=1 Tax=Curcuma longa TaxID=136217 RepID=UPI003D9F1648